MALSDAATGQPGSSERLFGAPLLRQVPLRLAKGTRGPRKPENRGCTPGVGEKRGLESHLE